MKVAIVGTGFAGYGALVALRGNPEYEIHVFDIGLTERYPGQADKPVANAKKHKDSFFTYGINDGRWPVKLGSERICSSHAFGGHSTVYSGAVLYPKEADLKEWPEESRPQAGDYAAILEDMRILHGDDELSLEFPPVPNDAVLRAATAGSPRAVLGLSRIALEKEAGQRDSGARLFRSDASFEKLRSAGDLTYHGDCYVMRLAAEGNSATIECETRDGAQASFSGFDAVFVGAGCVNTTGIIDRSLFGEGSRDYEMRSVGSLIGAFVRLPAPKSPSHAVRWGQSLPELFLEINSPLTRSTWMHTQLTAINDQIIDAIDSKIPLFGALLGKFMRRFIYFSLSTFHSRHSRAIGIRCTSAPGDGEKGMKHSIFIDEIPAPGQPSDFAAALRRGIREHWPKLRMLPFPFGGALADFFRGNKLGGWHLGGTLPMKPDPAPGECRPSGEVCGLENVYITDSSAFPEVPGSTVALLSAAHAHRVVRSWMHAAQKR